MQGDGAALVFGRPNSDWRTDYELAPTTDGGIVLFASGRNDNATLIFTKEQAREIAKAILKFVGE